MNKSAIKANKAKEANKAEINFWYIKWTFLAFVASLALLANMMDSPS